MTTALDEEGGITRLSTGAGEDHRVLLVWRAPEIWSTLDHFKAHLSALVDAAEHRGKRILILRHGKPAAAIVPVAVAERASKTRAMTVAQAEALRDDLAAGASASVLPLDEAQWTSSPSRGTRGDVADGEDDLGDREHQEDAWVVRVRADAVLCAVCDGMGASTSGHPAASLTIGLLVARFDGGAAPAEVLAALEEGNREILARSSAARTRVPPFEHRWAGLGTTADVAVFSAGQVCIAHVGDGSIYCLDDAGFRSVTVVHSLLNDYRKARPELTAAELDAFPHRNIIVRALGMKPELGADHLVLPTTPGQIWLLCSDGLTLVLGEDGIAAILRSGGSSNELAERLITAAAAIPREVSGAKDNITAVVHVVGGVPKPP